MKKLKPIVSIILPTYNRAHLIEKSIGSVLTQTFINFELIVVDDGSTDMTESILKNINDNRIRYIKYNKRRGANYARNTGIKVANADYIAFQDSDDIWYPNKLEKQVSCMQHSPSNVAIIYSAFWRIENEQKEYISSNVIGMDQNFLFIALLKENFITTPTLLIKKECFKKVGLFDENLPRFQDWELVIRLSKLYHFNYINEATINSYVQLDSISLNNKAQTIALEMIVKKHLLDFLKYKKLLISHYETIGIGFYLEGNTKKANFYLMKAYRLNLLNLKLLIKYLIIKYTNIKFYLKLKKFNLEK